MRLTVISTRALRWLSSESQADDTQVLQQGFALVTFRLQVTGFSANYGSGSQSPDGRLPRIWTREAERPFAEMTFLAHTAYRDRKAGSRVPILVVSESGNWTNDL